MSTLNNDGVVFGAGLAIDGDKSGVYPGSWSCSHTDNEVHPWWVTDLGHNATISSVSLTARNAGKMNSN